MTTKSLVTDKKKNFCHCVWHVSFLCLWVFGTYGRDYQGHDTCLKGEEAHFHFPVTVSIPRPDDVWKKKKYINKNRSSDIDSLFLQECAWFGVGMSAGRMFLPGCMLSVVIPPPRYGLVLSLKGNRRQHIVAHWLNALILHQVTHLRMENGMNEPFSVIFFHLFLFIENVPLIRQHK